MTQQPQQLKFGDRVRCKQTGAEGLIIDTGKTAAWILWEGQRCSNFYAYDTFEPIPHPDTSRLDWMIMREHADDLRAEDKVFVLQTYRENIDIRIRLAAKLAAEGFCPPSPYS